MFLHVPLDLKICGGIKIYLAFIAVYLVLLITIFEESFGQADAQLLCYLLIPLFDVVSLLVVAAQGVVVWKYLKTFKIFFGSPLLVLSC